MGIFLVKKTFEIINLDQSNTPYNFSYPQAGFLWLVDRKLVNLKGGLSWTIYRETPGLRVASSVMHNNSFAASGRFKMN
jgi:hypothetical protein